MAILFILFALAMAAGTLLKMPIILILPELLFYNAVWFEVIMVFYHQLLGNIKRYQLQKENWGL